MRREEIERLRGLCAAATPGPWTLMHFKRYDLHGDAAFMAEARTAMPALLDEVERLQAKCSRLEMMNDEKIDRIHEVQDEHAEEHGDRMAEKLSGELAVSALRAEVERLQANLIGAQRVLWSIINDLGGEILIPKAKALEALDPNCVLERIDEQDGAIAFIAHKEGIDK